MDKNQVRGRLLKARRKVKRVAGTLLREPQLHARGRK